MTKDFRHVGRAPRPAAPAEQPVPPPAADLAAQRRLILRIVQAGALSFLLAGVWLMSGQPSPLPREISFHVGLALVAAALADAAVIFILGRIWRENPRR
jgi:hypothetical protein